MMWGSDITDQFASGVSCCEHIDFAAGNLRVSDIGKAKDWIRARSYGVINDDALILGFLACAASGGRNDYTRAAHLPGISASTILERMIQLYLINDHRGLYPFMVSFMILRPFCLFERQLFICCLALALSPTVIPYPIKCIYSIRSYQPYRLCISSVIQQLYNTLPLSARLSQSTAGLP